MKPFTMNLLAFLVVTTTLILSALFAIADSVSSAAKITRSAFSNTLAYVLKPLIAVAGLSTAATVMAVESVGAPDISLGLIDLILPFLIDKAATNPIIATCLAVFAMSQPLIGIIANRTKNPHVGKFAIFGNKVLQLMTFNSAKNQPDVLSVSNMIKTRPKHWEEKIRDKILTTVY